MSASHLGRVSLALVFVAACGGSGDSDPGVSTTDALFELGGGASDASTDGSGDTADAATDVAADADAAPDADPCAEGPGARCDGAAVVVCDAEGEVARVPCGRSQDCVDAACVDRPCNETDDFCVDERVIARCNPEADAFFEEDCHPQLVCADGACVFADGTNACGGDAILEALPGEACGDCGTRVCDPDDANTVVCEDAGLNACGGCAPIDVPLGTECGVCGIWACGDGAVVCDDPGTNACGWCGALEGEPGAPCGECGTWACDSGGFLRPRGVACDDPGANRCGGCTDLPTFPGDLCEDPAEVYVCSGGDALRCQRNLTDSCFTAIECNLFAAQFGVVEPLRLSCDDEVGCYLKASCSPDGIPTETDPFGSACVGGSECAVVPFVDIQICTGCTVGDPSTCRNGEECQDLFGLVTVCGDPLFALP